MSQKKASDAATAKDRVFAEPHATTDFKFNKKVASVFDDMVSRSVPYYDEMQRMVSTLATDFAVEGTNVYDLGCATATTLIALDKLLPGGVNMVGVDDSE